MRRVVLTLLSLFLSITGLPAQAPVGQDRPVSPGSDFPVEILYVPRGDLPHAPGYSKEGAFLPLGEILKLAAQAQAQPVLAEKENGGLTIPQIRLQGTFETSGTQASAPVLTLSGEIEYRMQNAQWAAAAVDTGVLPWTAQTASTSQTVALARVQGQTYLFCKGPAQGKLAVQARIAAPDRTVRQTFEFGRFHAPCRIELDLGTETRLVQATEPYFIENASAVPQTPSRVILLPTQNKAVSVLLDRRVSIQTSSSLQVQLQRRIAVRAGGLEVRDRLFLKDRFQPDVPLESSLPEGLELLNVNASPSVKTEVVEGKLRLTPREELKAVTVETTFSVHLTDRKALLNTWKFPAFSEYAELKLHDSSEEAVVLEESEAAGSSTLLLASAVNTHADYFCFGPLPPLHVAVVSKRKIQPPVVAGRLTLNRSEAEAHYTIYLQGHTRTDLSLTLPDGWVSQEIQAFRQQEKVPEEKIALNAVQTQGNDWQLSWDPAHIPNRIEWSLHRSGAWGVPETETRLDFPLLTFPEGRPSRYEINLSCSPVLDVRTENLLDLALLPVAIQPDFAISNRVAANQNASSSHNPLNANASQNSPGTNSDNRQPQAAAQAPQSDTGVPPVNQAVQTGAPDADPGKSFSHQVFRVQGAHPTGTLVVKGRPADVQATVAEALSIDEDQAKVRALIQFHVRFAPVDTFQFLLPTGTERIVRISGDELREQNCETTPEGDLWTVTTQKQMTGDYALTVEWPLPGTPTTDALQAPEIRIPRVSSQRGFLLLEGSETLELEMKTSGVTEADMAELPPLPWTSPHRILAVYRYVAPPFNLTVQSRKHPATPPLSALVLESNLTTALDPLGMRVTQAQYTVLPTSNPQFFEIRLPRKASIWSVLVDGTGVKPARREGETGEPVFLIPLPAVQTDTKPCQVSLIYREETQPLKNSSHLNLTGPVLPVPINKSSWKLYLPRGFEYLAFDAGLGKFETETLPMARFLREADYPKKILFPQCDFSKIMPSLLIGSSLVLLITGIYFVNRKKKQEGTLWTEKKAILSLESGETDQTTVSEETATPPPLPPTRNTQPQNHGCLSRLLPWLIILVVIGVLSLIATPNFLESQTRAKVSRVQSDLRSVVTALETYNLDNKGYPEKIEALWQGQVAYLNSAPTDPFGGESFSSSRGYGENTRLRYLAGAEAYRNALSAGLIQPGEKVPSKKFYLLYSFGPDGADDRGSILYDATNGTVSRGDIVKIGGDSHSTAWADSKEQKKSVRSSKPLGGGEISRAVGGPSLGDKLAYDSSNGTSSAGDISMGTEIANGKHSETKDASRKPAATPPPAPTPLPQAATAPATQPLRADADQAALELGVPEQVDYSMITPPPGQSAQEQEMAPGLVGADLIRGRESKEGYLRQLAAGENEEEASQKPQGKPATAVQRQRGLLSLAINLPVGGTPKTFSLPGTMESVKVRLMEEKSFLSVRFLMWAVTSLTLCALWVFRRRAYLPTFLVLFLLALIVPVLCNTAWVVFYNTAFKGVLTSLIAPLLSHLLRSWNSIRSLKTPTVSLLFLALLLSGTGNGSVVAQTPPPQATPQQEAKTITAPGQGTLPIEDPTVRVLVPYDPEKIPNLAALRGQSDNALLAFISKSAFARLWQTAETAGTSHPLLSGTPILTSLEISTALDPEQSLVRGSFRLLAANRSETPRSRKLLMPTLLLGQWQASSPGAVLETSPSGLILNLAPRWCGTVTADFTLPCQILGGGGSMELLLPEALGVWQFSLPYPTAQVDLSGAPGEKNGVWTQEHKGGKTLLKTALKEGRRTLRWKSSTATGTGSPGTAHTATACNVEIRTTWIWNHLAGADWNTTLDLTPLEPGSLLPERILFTLPRGLHLYDAQGEALRKVAVEPGDTQSSPTRQMTLELVPAPAAKIQLTGVVFNEPSNPDWLIAPLQPIGQTRATSHLNLEFDPALTILASQVTGLERQPASSTPETRVVQNYLATGADWQARLKLAPARTEYKASIEHFAIPLDGFLRQAAQVTLTPIKNSLRRCWLEVPAQTRVSALDGERPFDWFQYGNRVLVTFDPPLETATPLKLFATSEITSSAQIELGTFVPVEATETHQTVVLSVPNDQELIETALNGASPRPIPESDTALSLKLLPVPELSQGTLRGYERTGSKPLRLGLRPIQASVLNQVHNVVTFSEGLQKTDCNVVSNPRKGQVRRIELFLLLPKPDPSLASRLQTSGPIRQVTTHPISERLLRVEAELEHPYSEPFQIGFSVDQPVSPEEYGNASALIFIPAVAEGSRTFLVLRREFEGDLSLREGVPAQTVDSSKIVWPAPSTGPQPSDKPYELLGVLRDSPALRLERYARTEALRAVVELVRQRTQVRKDGLERHELRVVLQNRSEQFLSIALPYPSEQVEIYQTLVAGRAVKTTVQPEKDKTILLLPLIRTGLLDPELVVRVAYTARTGIPVEKSGKRQQRVPEILGGIPVGQSVLELMLPPHFDYENFKGSLKPVDLVDIETEDLLRQTRRVEKLSEILLQKQDEQTKMKALPKLLSLQQSLSSRSTTQKRTNEAYNVQVNAQKGGLNKFGKDVAVQQESLAKERQEAMSETEKSVEQLGRNVQMLNEAILPQTAANQPGMQQMPQPQPQAQPQPSLPTASQEPPETPPVTFPSIGDTVFAFRTLQGTGEVTFKFTDQESARNRWDGLFVLGATILAFILALCAPALLANTHRLVLALMALSLLAILFRFGWDLAIPLFVILIFVERFQRKRVPGSRP